MMQYLGTRFSTDKIRFSRENIEVRTGARISCVLPNIDDLLRISSKSHRFFNNWTNGRIANDDDWGTEGNWKIAYCKLADYYATAKSEGRDPLGFESDPILLNEDFYKDMKHAEMKVLAYLLKEYYFKLIPDYIEKEKEKEKEEEKEEEKTIPSALISADRFFLAVSRRPCKKCAEHLQRISLFFKAIRVLYPRLAYLSMLESGETDGANWAFRFQGNQSDLTSLIFPPGTTRLRDTMITVMNEEKAEASAAAGHSNIITVKTVKGVVPSLFMVPREQRGSSGRSPSAETISVTPSAETISVTPIGLTQSSPPTNSVESKQPTRLTIPTDLTDDVSRVLFSGSTPSSTDQGPAGSLQSSLPIP